MVWTHLTLLQLKKLVGARGWRPLWSPPWVPMTFGRQCEVLEVLFFLIFYSLFGPCPARLALPPAPPCPVTCPLPRPALSGRPFSESDWSGRFPFSESGRPGRFRRVIKTRNCRVGRTHARTDTHVVIIYRMAFSFSTMVVVICLNYWYN
jgi:hypothetical protein